MQTFERLEYRDKMYSMMGTPLEPFLESKNLNFDVIDSLCWRGYIGHWILKEDRLYLKDIETNDDTFLDIFNTEKPITADWFSGNVSFGIGESHWNSNLEVTYFDYYVSLSVSDGIVTSREINAHVDQDPEFNFGKYKGKKIDEVVNGRVLRNTYTTLKDFIICLMDFVIESDYGYKIKCPYFKVSEQDRSLVRETRRSRIDYFLTQNFIAISSKVFWEDTNEDESAEQLSLFIERILTSDFRVLSSLTREDLESAEFAEQSVLINGDFQYLNWALKNVDFFSIPPNILEKEFSIKTLTTLKTKRLNKLIFEYEPIVEINKVTFPKNILSINREKFEESRNVKYDSENDIYIPALSQEDMMNRYGHYLDEDFIQQSEPEHDSYNDDHTYNQNDWLRDAAGTDDPEVMNDVFWNLD